MAYDPEAHGALCSQCVLKYSRLGGPVAWEHNPGSQILVVAETPARDECRLGRPLIGASGQELERALHAVGLRRYDVSLSNALLCWPGDDGFEKLTAHWKMVNAERRKQNQDPLPHPIVCCRARLLAELRQFRNIIVIGKQAYYALTHRVVGILTARGQAAEGVLDENGAWHPMPEPDYQHMLLGNADTVRRLPAVASADPTAPSTALVKTAPEGPVTFHKVMPTVHPAFVLRYRRWTAAFRADFARALRWFRNAMQWTEPRKVFVPTPEYLYAFLNRPAPFFAVDTETDDIEPLLANLRCVIVGRPDEAVVVPFLSVDGESKFYSDHDEHRVAEILRAFLANPRIVKVGHNFRSYDVHIVRRYFGVTATPVVDTLALAHAACPELPHDLQFVGQTYVDVHGWKDHGEGKGWRSKTDPELWEYGALDGAVNSIIVPPLQESVRVRNQEEVVRVRHKLMDFCAGMHQVGMCVDRAKVGELQVRFRTEALVHLKKLRDITGDPNLNPNSVHQLRRVVYDRWRLPMTKFSEKTGAPSVDDEVVRAMLIKPGLDAQHRAFFDNLRRFRRGAKFLGTYLLKLKPRDEEVVADELAIDVGDDGGFATLTMAREGKSWSYDSDDAEAYQYEAVLDKNISKKVGYIHADGRLHPFYNACGTKGWRYSSSDPNCQNWPSLLRACIIAAAGHVLIQVDMDQIEFRFVVCLSGSPRYMDVFNSGGDAHAVTADMCFGEAFTKLDKKDPLWKEMRQTGKTIRFATQYGAEWETVHQVVISTEDRETGNLLYATFKEDQTRRLYERMLERDPHLPRWWEAEQRLFRAQNCLIEPVYGMRLDFLDGEERNKILSFRCQSGSAAVVHKGTLELAAKYPPEFAGPGTGFINQTHDSLLMECPAEMADQVASDMKEAMTRTIPGLPLKFTCTVKVGKPKVTDAGVVVDPYIRWSTI